MKIFLIVNNVVDRLGPGTRLCLWTMGCSQRCPGCVSPETRYPDPKSEIDVIATLEKMDLSKNTAVTISGGEPFDQLEALDRLTEYLALRFEDILIFSGKRYEELKDDPHARRIFARISLLVDGPYVAELNADERLRGSSNQHFVFFKERYRSAYLAYNQSPRDPGLFEVDGAEFGVGLPPKKIAQGGKV